MKIRSSAMVLFMSLPWLAQAQGFKCKLADGSLSFQEQPCPAGATSSAMPSAPDSSGIGGPATQPKGAAAGGAATRAASRPDPRGIPNQAQDREREKQRRQAEEEINAHNKEVLAYNKMQRCNYARSQLGVVKEYKPVYQRNDKGERIYVEDSNRAAVIAAAEQRVAEACH